MVYKNIKILILYNLEFECMSKTDMSRLKANKRKIEDEPISQSTLNQRTANTKFKVTGEKTNNNVNKLSESTQQKNSQMVYKYINIRILLICLINYLKN